MRKLLIEKIKKIVAYIILVVFGTLMIGGTSFGLGMGLTMGETTNWHALLVGFGFFVSLMGIVSGLIWALYETGLLD